MEVNKKQIEQRSESKGLENAIGEYIIDGEETAIRRFNDEGEMVAEITFPETDPGVYTIDHTFVDSSLRGQGVAGMLVQLAVEEIQRRDGVIAATCSYARKWLEEKGYAF